MIEFLQTYGLWIALAGVFFTMHRFGMGCCGGQKHGLTRRAQGPADGNPKGENSSDVRAKSSGTSL